MPRASRSTSLCRPARATERCYEAFESLLAPLARAFRPQLLLVSAGYDPQSGDPLGDLQFSRVSFQWMAARLTQMAEAAGAAGPLCFLEGGYVPEMMAESVVATLTGLEGHGSYVRACRHRRRAGRRARDPGGDQALLEGCLLASVEPQPSLGSVRSPQVAGLFLRHSMRRKHQLLCRRRSGMPRGEVVMKNIDELLLQVKEAGASDLHLKVGSPPVIRVDGELTELDEPTCSPEDTKDYAASLMSEKQIRRFSETNEIDFAYSAPNSGRYRVNVYRQRGTISIAMRHVVTRVPNFLELNLPPVVQTLALEPRGMVLVTGTTGSGKTTTLAAMIDHINHIMRRHIVTIEDPIEILHRDIKCIVNQREIGLDTENYGTALKYVLRQDPDIILIGEMRDQETVRTALTAAQTGHFVMSTLHTIDVAETINRIIDFFPLYQQKQVRIMLAGSLRGIISQRLLVRGDGKGRVPAVEVMVMTGRIRDMILDAGQTHNIKTALAEGDFYGMQTFDQSLLDLFEHGLVSLADAQLVASSPHDFRLLVQSHGHEMPALV